MIFNDCKSNTRGIVIHVSIFSIDAFTNVLLNVLFNAMANVAIYTA